MTQTIVLKIQEISCAGLTIFAISLLLWVIFLSIRVILSQIQWIFDMHSTVAADPAVSCNKNRPSLMNFPIIQEFSRVNVHLYTQIPLIVPNIQNPHRDTAEILKLHKLGMRLLSNPNKYWYYWILLPGTGHLKICMVGAFSAYEIHFCTYFTYFTVNLQILLYILLIKYIVIVVQNATWMK